MDKKNETNTICPECGEYKPDDERVQNGMKCAACAGYGTVERADQ